MFSCWLCAQRRTSFSTLHVKTPHLPASRWVHCVHRKYSKTPCTGSWVNMQSIVCKGVTCQTGTACHVWIWLCVTWTQSEITPDMLSQREGGPGEGGRGGHCWQNPEWILENEDDGCVTLISPNQRLYFSHTIQHQPTHIRHRCRTIWFQKELFLFKGGWLYRDIPFTSTRNTCFLFLSGSVNVSTSSCWRSVPATPVSSSRLNAHTNSQGP